ncbi:MAG: hypothetical protein HC872_06975, partial [Gammaproteobacteria bacterium]|nr:hypothetical protein [Gammaproteobacteria bacterium]
MRAGTLTVGELVMISAYVLQVARPIEGLGYALQQLSQGAAFLEHMIGILRMPEEA